MQIETSIEKVSGNGRTVELSSNVCTHTNKRTYFINVIYNKDHDLNFSERREGIQAARRTFKTLSKLCEW